jgi:copper transport protein
VTRASAALRRYDPRWRPGRRWRATWRTAVSLAAALLLALLPLAAAPVSAHAELVGAAPADGEVLQSAPTRVQLFFSEPIERDFYALEVYTANRQRVDRRDARIPPTNVQSLEASLVDTGPGIYTVVWRVLSIDGHVVRGVYSYSVGVPGQAAGTAVLPAGWEERGAPFALGAAVRWLTYLCVAVLVGGFAFLPLVLGPALDGAGLSGSLARNRALQRATRRFLWLAWPAVALLLVLTLLALVLQAADATGGTVGEVFSGRAITRLLSGTKYGALWLGRAFLVAGLLFAVMAASLVGSSGPGPRLVAWGGAATGAALLLVLAATGHASAVTRNTWLSVGADWVHLLAGAVWVGGLVQLALALPAALDTLDPAPRRAVLAGTVRRFSVLALVCVGAVIGTGVYAGVIHVPRWEALADTAYGAALSGKLLLLLPLLALGAVNLVLLGPRFARQAGAGGGQPAAATAERPQDAAGRRLFRRIVGAEALLAVLVLGVTGILTGLPPASTAPGEGQPVRETARAGDLSVTLAVDPNQAGSNSFQVSVTDSRGVPVAAERVDLELSHQDMEMGAREVQLVPVGAGRYEASGGYLSMAGRWQAEVRLRRPGVPAGAAGSEASTTFAFTVGQPAGTGRPALSPLRILLNAASPQTGLALLILALAGLLYQQRRRARRRQRQPLGWAGAALAVVGLVALSGSLGAAYRQSQASALPVVNPIPAGPESLALGQQLYTQSCMVCHGVTGRGDGPAGRALRPPPADFRVHMAAGHTDAQLFDWISNGVPGTAMGAFKEQLSADEIWHLINYIRTFAQPAGTPSGAP